MERKMIRSSDTGGVKPMAIAGRTVRERERMIGMTDEERAWRKKWVKDQVLTDREPVYVQEYWDSIRNPIRRLYTRPLNTLYYALQPIIGHDKAVGVRVITGKLLMTAALLYAGAYYFKYNQNDWTTKSGWRILKSRKRVLPGDPGWPAKSDRNEPSDYFTNGFKTSPI